MSLHSLARCDQGWRVARVGILFAGLSLALGAQTRMSPDDAIQMALERNQYLAAGSARIDAARGLETQAGLKPNPRLVLQVENARIPVGGPLKYERDTDNFAYAQRVFEVGGKRKRRIELAQENTGSAERVLNVQRTQLASRVLTAYWNAVGAQRLAAVLGETRDVLAQTVEYQKNRLQAGALPEADLIRVQLEYQQVAINHTNALQDAKRLLQLLFREIGVEPEPGVLLTGELSSIDALPLVDIEQAIDSRPDVRLAQQATRQGEAAVRLQRANAVPDPELVFGYKRTLGFDTVVAGFQINLPFQNRNQGTIAAALADLSAATSNLRAARLAARVEIEAALGEYQQKRELLQDMVPPLRQQANETSRIADAVYREGASDLLRLLDAQRVRIQAETQYVRSLLDFRQAEINLRTALGQLP